MTHREFAVEVLEATKGVSSSAIRVHLAILARLDVGEHSRAENIAKALGMTERSVYRALAELRGSTPSVEQAPPREETKPVRKKRTAAPSDEEMLAVRAIIDEFNQTFGTAIRSANAHAPYIVRRLRNPDFADLTIDDHRAIIRHARLNQWFDSPTPNVIYGKDSLLDTARSRWLTGATAKNSGTTSARVERQQRLLAEGVVGD
jgi:hypothetical protein